MIAHSPRIFGLTLVTAFSASSAGLKAEILTPPDVTASAAEFSAQYAATNVFDSDAGDYASQGQGADTFLEFQFPSPTAFDKIVVLSRDSPAPGDWIGDFTLTFDDGPTVSINREAARGVSALHDTGAVTASKVRLDVDTIGDGGGDEHGGHGDLLRENPDRQRAGGQCGGDGLRHAV